MFGLTSIKSKLIIFGIILSIFGGAGLYVWHLNHQVDKLQTQKVELTTKLEGATATIDETSRREQVVDKVSAIVDSKRQENQRIYEKKVHKVDEDVTQGKDRPVGPLLTEFFNDGL
jgi:hypothetical protein